MPGDDATSPVGEATGEASVSAAAVRWRDRCSSGTMNNSGSKTSNGKSIARREARSDAPARSPSAPSAPTSPRSTTASRQSARSASRSSSEISMSCTKVSNAIGLGTISSTPAQRADAGTGFPGRSTTTTCGRGRSVLGCSWRANSEPAMPDISPSTTISATSCPLIHCSALCGSLKCRNRTSSSERATSRQARWSTGSLPTAST